MKSTGIVRGIDALGRIVLPKELRTSMHLDTDTKLEIDHGGHGKHLSFMHQWTVECSFQSNVSYNVYTILFILLQ